MANHWRHGENYVCEKLFANGIGFTLVAITTKRGMPDIITDEGIAIDVKTACVRQLKKGSEARYWTFNLHHCSIRQNNVDFFVCVLVDQRHGVLPFVLSSNSISAKTFRISEKQLNRGKYNYAINRWDFIKTCLASGKKDLAHRAKMLRIRDALISPEKRDLTPVEQAKLRIERYKKRRAACRGRKLSEKTRTKMSRAKLGIKRKPFTKEHRKKISESKRKAFEARKTTKACRPTTGRNCMADDKDKKVYVQLTTPITLKQKRALKAAAVKDNVKMADIVRRGLDMVLGLNK